MDVIRYCDSAGDALIRCKAALYDLMRVEVWFPESEQKPDSLQQIHLLIDEIERGILELKEDPPLDFTLNREAIDAKLGRLRGLIAEQREELQKEMNNENRQSVIKKRLSSRLAQG